MTSGANSKEAEMEIARLGDLDRSELIDLWIRAYRHAPPKGASRKLLVRAAAYSAQVKLYRGLKRSVHRQLMQIAAGNTSIKPLRVHRQQLKPGVRLIRQWQGISHTVEVVENGFKWNGEVHRSLSAIAKSITGARWSGPRFFRL